MSRFKLAALIAIPLVIVGGAFVYAMPEGLLSVGFVTGLDYRDPMFDPHQTFLKFKRHPLMAKLPEGGKMVRYGAKALPEGGWHTAPRVTPVADPAEDLLVADAAALPGPWVREALKALEVRLKDVKLRQGTLKAKARGNRDGTMTSKTSAFADFDRMSSRIDATEAEASLDDELGNRTTQTIAVDRRLDQMASDAAVDDALAELKRKLGK